MNAKQLIHVQLALECIGLDAEGLLVRTPGSNPDEIARLYIYQHRDRHTVYFRSDMPRATRARIADLDPDTVFLDHEPVKRLLIADGAPTRTFTGQTYLFPDSLNPGQFLDAIRLTQARRPLVNAYLSELDFHHQVVCGVIRDGQIVSACASAREDDHAAEAYVYTAPAFRRQGLAQQTTAAWAYHVQLLGKIPFYSHSHDNAASQALAQSLMLEPCFALVSFS